MRIGLAVLLLTTAPALAADPSGMVTKAYPVGDLIFTATTAPAAPATPPAVATAYAVPLAAAAGTAHTVPASAPVVLARTQAQVTPPPAVALATPAPAVPAIAPLFTHSPATGVMVNGMLCTPPPLPPSVRRNAEGLMRVVMSTIKPESWDCGGGAGKLAYDESGLRLIVTQTAEGQADVAELLASLRKLQAKSNPQVVVLATVAVVESNFMENAKQCLGCEAGPTAEGAKHAVIGFSAEKAQEFKNMLRDAKDAGKVGLLAQPHLVLIEDQTGTFEAAGHPVVVQAKITPKVSADRKQVTLRLKCSHSAVDKAPVAVKGEKTETPADVVVMPVLGTETIETTVVLPNGGLGVIPGPVRASRQTLVILTPQVLTPHAVAPIEVKVVAPPVAVAKPAPAMMVAGTVAVAPVGGPVRVAPQPYVVVPACPAVPVPVPVATPPVMVTSVAPVVTMMPTAPVQVTPGFNFSNTVMLPVASSAATSTKTVAPLPHHAEPQVMVQMTIVEVGPQFFERFGLDFGKSPTCEDPQSKCVSVGLTAEQARSLGTAIRSGSQTGYLEILSRPQMNLTEGQTGTFQTGMRVPLTTGGSLPDAEVKFGDTGILAALTPQISADRKAVTLRLNYTHSAVNPTPVVLRAASDKTGEAVTARAVDKQTIEASVTLPCGGTGLILGPARKCETRTETAVPVLSNVPYMSRLFRNVAIGSETRQQLIILTPRIMNTPEDRAVWFGEETKRMSWPNPQPVVMPACPAPSKTAALLADYRKACAEGRTEDAMKCAMQALAIDPKCFATEK